MQNIEDNEKDFVTEKDIEHILNQLSDEILIRVIEEKIKDSFNGKFNSSYNQLDYFNVKYDYLCNKYSAFNHILEKIKTIKNKLYNRILKALEEKLDIEVNFSSLHLEDRQYEIIEHLYKFFILNSNILSINLVDSYIKNERKSLLSFYKNTLDKKDLLYTNNRKKINKDALLLMYRLSDIIENIIIPDYMDLIELAVGEDVEEITNIDILKIFQDDSLINVGENFTKVILGTLNENIILYLEIKNKLFESSIIEDGGIKK